MNDNILYFQPNVDLRICPKNGFTSSKLLYYSTHGKQKVRDFKWKKGGPENWRAKQFWDAGDTLDPPFRKGSIRFAVKRDPVKRFLSCIDHLQGETIVQCSDRDYPHFKSLEDAVSAMERGEVMNWHLMSQTYYMGRPEQYDYVYDLSQLNFMFEHIYSLINKPVIDTDHPPEKIHQNKSTPTLSREVTSDIVLRIRKLYSVDYENGWY
jgi:hypothetical protein